MLGRRLLVLFAVLLGLTALVTSLAPRPTAGPRPTGPGAATPASTPTPTPTSQTSSRRIERTISADAGRPRTRVRARAGDVLARTVRGDLLDAVEIAGLGKLESVEPGSPARFEMLLDTPGEFRVTLLDAQRAVGLIEVAPTP
ncbi:MAG: hypothetical protein ABI611_15725 [Solirubrobacteraceae bacterium]